MLIVPIPMVSYLQRLKRADPHNEPVHVGPQGERPDIGDGGLSIVPETLASPRRVALSMMIARCGGGISGRAREHSALHTSAERQRVLLSRTGHAYNIH